MLFDPKNYPKLFIRGESVHLWFTNIIRKNHAYNQRTKRLRDTSEGETLYFIVVYGQWLIVTFGRYSANGRDRPVILQFAYSSQEIERFAFYVEKLVRIFLVEQHKFLITK